MARREGAGGHRSPLRRPRPRLLVICGARQTESRYFTGLRASLASPAVDVRVTAHAKAPAQVVEHARHYADRSAVDFDEVWCVVDADEFDIESAARLARSTGIELAVSYPCFELWLLLHHQDCRAHFARCGDVAERLRKHLPRYDKADLRFSDFAGGVALAAERAKQLDPERNPSTGVWRLVERMVAQQ
jgi:hypothetical protein